MPSAAVAGGPISPRPQTVESEAVAAERVVDLHQNFPQRVQASAIELDHTVKKNIYEQIFRTPEYFCYDPDGKKLDGWRLDNGKYRTIDPNDKGWLWSEQLKSWLGTWEGFYLNRETTWLRLFTEDGALVPTTEESAAKKVASAQAKAAAAAQSSEEQRRRAEAAEAEIAKLKAQLELKKD